MEEKQTAVTNAQKGNSSKIIVMVIVGVLLLCCCSCAAFFGLFGYIDTGDNCYKAPLSSGCPDMMY